MLVGVSLLLAHASSSVAEVYAVSGIVTWLGRQKLLVLWGFEAALSVSFAAAAAALLGRVSPRRVLLAAVAVCGVTFSILSTLFLLRWSPGPLVALLAVVDRLQMNVVYYASWALARELFDAEETVRWFGPINAATLLGSLAGTATAGLAARRGWTPGAIMAALAVSFWAGRVALGSLLRGLDEHRAASQEEEPETPKVRLRDALAHLRSTPVLRNMAALSLCNGVGYTVLAYEVLRRLADDAATTAHALGRFALLFAALRIAEPVVYTVVEAFLASPLIHRAKVTTVFSMPPLVLLTMHPALWAMPVPLLAVAASCALQGAFAMDEPLRAGFVASQPQELRVALGAINDGTFYQAGYITGVLLLATVALVGMVAHLSPATLRVAELALGSGAGVVGLLAVRRLGRMGAALRLRRETAR